MLVIKYFKLEKKKISKNLNNKPTENINNKMEADAICEIKGQEIKNDIKVEDFFIKEQYAHFQDGIKKENLHIPKVNNELVNSVHENEKIKSNFF
jgi:hypothetical protein